MAAGSVSTLLLLVILSLCLTSTLSESVPDPAPTPAHDTADTSSGGGAYDLTTRDPYHDPTENPFTFEYEDTTYTQPSDGEEGVLGPGAIATIVIAVILGASVLIALIVITLKKFTTA
ncbi:protein SNORC [Arapaima gigas]